MFPGRLNIKLALLLMIFGFNLLQPIVTDAQVIKSVKRLSLSPHFNQQGDSYSYDPEISGDGNIVVFTSTADNFAASGNTEGQFFEHGYFRNISSNSTTQLDLTPGGRSGTPGMSFNTGVRTFSSSFDTHISRDGKYAAFITAENDIISDGLSENAGTRVYLKNLESGETQRLPYASEGDSSKVETPAYIAINADGSVVVIMSIIGNLSDTIGAGSAWELTVYDKISDRTSTVNTGISGNKFNPGISDDGRFVVFENQPGDFSAPTYSYLYDRLTNSATVLNSGDRAFSPSISGDGKFIAYSDASGFLSKIKLLERETNVETVISKTTAGADSDGFSDFPSLSIDGRYTAFLSTASNLVADDSNNLDDIFVYDRIQRKTILVSVQAACNIITSTERFNTGPPSISSDGKVIAFSVLERLQPAAVKNSAGQIDPADTDKFDDVYAAEIDFDAQPSVFNKGLKPESPFVSVDCTGKDANIKLESVRKSKGVLQDVKIKQITQEISINRITGNKSETVKKLISKRNLLTAKKLPPGNYSAQVRVGASYSSGKVVYSKVSKPAKFTIQ